MGKFDEISKSFKDLYQKLSVSGRRTAAVTRLRIELSGYDKKRNELYARLGERLDELRRTDRINDAGLLSLLGSEFESIDRIRAKIQDTMDSIQQFNLEETEMEGVLEFDLPEENPEKEENLLDSFKVL
jgi:transcriptional regulator of heat shock response